MADNNLELFKYLAKNDKEINKLFDQFVIELANAGIQFDQLPTDDIFKYSKYPEAAKKAVEVAKKFRTALRKRLTSAISGAIALAERVTTANFAPFSNFKDNILDEHRKRVTEAFMAYRVNTQNGLSLSDRVWNYTEQTKAEFELGLSQVLEDGIRVGESAEEIGRKVRGKLKNPDAMWRRYHLKKTLKSGKVVDVVEWRKRVVDPNGKVHFVNAPLDHPGVGVYRSARQNALRMASTEINMAYRYMDNQRYQSEPFVLGIRINLSGHRSDKVKNFHDMCDDLAGDYPKWFLWSGWHPRCKCFMTSILCSEEEMRKIQSLPEEEYVKYKSPNLITDMPDNYTDYLAVNEDRLERSIERGTQPYWIRDNYVDGDPLKGFIKDTLEVPVATEEDYMTTTEIKSKEERVAAIQEAARKRHAARNEEDIQRRWDIRYIERWKYKQMKWETDPNNLTEEYLRANLNKMVICVNNSGVYDIDFVKKADLAELRKEWKKQVRVANKNLDFCSSFAKITKDTALDILKKDSSYPVVSRLRMYLENTNDHHSYNLANRIAANAKGASNLMELVKRNVDFSIVSPNMPYQLLADSTDYPMDGYVLDKRLFDSLEHYVPVVIDSKDGGFHKDVPIKVHLNKDSKRGKYNNISVIYHEYGHALDSQDGYLSASVDDLMFEYSKKYKQQFEEIESNLRSAYISACKHPWFESKRKSMEQVMAEMDVIQSITKGKYGCKDIDGHSARGYWTGKFKKHHPHTEFVAHMSEYYFMPNEYAQKADPERYEAMRKLFEQCFIKQPRVFNSAEPVLSAAEIRAQKIAEAAAKRHAARTPEKEQMLRDFAKKHKEKWEKTVKLIERMTARSLNIDEANDLGSQLTKAYLQRNKHSVEHLLDLAHQIQDITYEYDIALMDATDIAAELDGISDIDIVSVTSSSSIKGLKEGTVMLQEKKVELLSLQYVDNPIEAAKTYSMSEVVGANNSIVKKLADIDAAVANYPGTKKQKLEQKKHLITKELKYINGDYGVDVKSKYRTWKISQDAYMSQFDEVMNLIAFETKKEQLDVYSLFSTSNKEYKELLSLAKDAYSTHDMAALDKYLNDIEQKKDALEKYEAQKAANKLFWNDAKSKIESIKQSLDLSNPDNVKLLHELEDAYRARRKKDTTRLINALSSQNTVMFGDECFTQERKDNASWFVNAKDANDEYFRESVDFVKGLSPEEREAFDGYTTGSSYITEPLRAIDGHYYYFTSKFDKAKKDISAMTEAMNRVTTSKDRWVKRDAGGWDFEYVFGLKTGELEAKKSVYSDLEILEKDIEDCKMKLEILQRLNNESGYDILKELQKEMADVVDEDIEYGDGHNKVEFEERKESIRVKSNAVRMFENLSPDDMSQKVSELMDIIADKEKEISRMQPMLFQEGMMGRDDSFMSTADCRRSWFEATGKKDVVYNIYLPQGSHAVYAHTFSTNGAYDGCNDFELRGYPKPKYVTNDDENEIILQRGNIFKLTKIRYNSALGKWIVDLELRGQLPKDFELKQNYSGVYCEYK